MQRGPQDFRRHFSPAIFFRLRAEPFVRKMTSRFLFASFSRMRTDYSRTIFLTCARRTDLLLSGAAGIGRIPDPAARTLRPAPSLLFAGVFLYFKFQPGEWRRFFPIPPRFPQKESYFSWLFPPFKKTEMFIRPVHLSMGKKSSGRPVRRIIRFGRGVVVRGSYGDFFGGDNVLLYGDLGEEMNF